MPIITNPIQRFFFDKLTRGGLDLVSSERVEQLMRWVNENEITEYGVTVTAEGDPQVVDNYERSKLKELLDTESWRSLLEDAGVACLEKALGVSVVTQRVGIGRKAPGSVPRGSVPGNLIGQYVAQLDSPAVIPRLFQFEVAMRSESLFNNPNIPEDERAKNLLYLLQDCAKAIDQLGGGADAAEVRRSLLQVFHASSPLAMIYGGADPDDDLLTTAWEIVWGTDPEDPQSSFDIDKDKKWIAYMSMKGEFVDVAEKIDNYLAALGKPAKVATFEKRSTLNWLVGDPRGNIKPSSRFLEAEAITSTGVNFAKKLLTDESVIGERSLDPTFDTKVDFFAYDNFVTLRQAAGDSLVPLRDAHIGITTDDGEFETVAIDQIAEVRRTPVAHELAIRLDSGESRMIPLAEIDSVSRLENLSTIVLELEDGTTKTIAAADVTEVRREIKEADGERKVIDTLIRGEEEIVGHIRSPFSFAGAKTIEDGTIVLANTEAALRAAVEAVRYTVTLKGGEKIPGHLDTRVSFHSAVWQDGCRVIKPVAEQALVARIEALRDSIVLKDGTVSIGRLASELGFATAERDEDGTLVLENEKDTPIIKGGESLRVEFQEVGEEHWRPVFKDAQGRRVDPRCVSTVIKDSEGNIKGDGDATGSYNASWWGFCDRNALQGLITMKYSFPQPQKGVTLKAGEQVFEFTQEDITKIVGRRLTELFPVHTQAGNRYDDVPDHVVLNDKTVLMGKIETDVDFHHADRREGDMMIFLPVGPNAPRGSLLIEIKSADGKTTEEEVEASGIVEVRRVTTRDQRGELLVKDTLVLEGGEEIAGTLVTNLSFSNAKQGADGGLVLESSEDDPIFGELKMTTVKGDAKRIPIANIAMLAREDENEILADEALAYVIRNNGVFSADSWSGKSVANGTRTVEEINRWRAGSADKPEWVPEELNSLVGFRGEVQNPDNLVFFSMNNKSSNYGGVKFWVEMDANNLPINSNIFSGQWDFLWGVEGAPRWNAPPTFNPNMPNDLVLQLYVRSLEKPEEAESVLPANWREYQ